MGLLRRLQHWLTGPGRPLAVADFVRSPIRWGSGPTRLRGRRWSRQWSGTSPSGCRRRRRGAAPPWRPGWLLALELLTPELHCSAEQICSQLRTDLAVRYACGLTPVQVNRAHDHFVLPSL